MVNIAIDDKIPFIRGVLEPYANVVYLPAKEFTKQRLLDVDALIIRTRTVCNAELLEGTAVKFIASATIGFDHIDTSYCKQKGIEWINAKGCNSSSVEQYVLAAMLELAHRRSFQLAGKTIGIVGVGHVGSKVARIAEVLGIKTLLCDPPRAKKEGRTDFVELSELVASSDIISIHVSLSRDGEDKTWGLFNREVISKIKKGAILINSSRGEVIDEAALKDSIKQGMLSDVVLDVWCNEPDIDAELMDMATIATPHIAGYSVDGKAMGTAMSVNALAQFFGWDLADWYPAHLPLPSKPQLQADFLQGTFEQNLYILVKQTYNILSDDSRLRIQIKDFEKQRGDYPIRREFDSFTVNIVNATDSDKQKLSQLRFQLP